MFPELCYVLSFIVHGEVSLSTVGMIISDDLSQSAAKRATKTCIAESLRNVFKSYITRFTTHVQTFLATSEVVERVTTVCGR